MSDQYNIRDLYGCVNIKMKKEKTKENAEDKWTYIRIRLSTGKKLKLLKVKRSDPMYDDTLNYLLSKENLEFKK